MKDAKQDNKVLKDVIKAEDNVLSDALTKVGKNPTEILDAGEKFAQSLNDNVHKSTSEYTTDVAKAGGKSLIKGIIIGCIAAVTTVLLGPFGVLGLAGAALISLALGSALVVGTQMYDEKKAREKEEKEKQDEKSKLSGKEKDQSISKEKEDIHKDISTDRITDVSQDISSKTSELTTKEKAEKDLAEKSKEISEQSNDTAKKKGGAKEFFARTAKLFGASTGMLIVAVLSIIATVAVGAVLAPILGPITAGVVATCAGATVGFGAKVGISAISHKINKSLIENDIIERQEALVQSIKTPTIETTKILEHETVQQLVTEHKNTLQERDAEIQKQNARIAELEKQLASIKEVTNIKEVINKSLDGVSVIASTDDKSRSNSHGVESIISEREFQRGRSNSDSSINLNGGNNHDHVDALNKQRTHSVTSVDSKGI